ncbi:MULTISPECIES: ABC transporter substrate-binding protein [Streptomyces]|uniref:ABC transporter substrate-binding protein n=1 Tax=Streptomyces TaxID=1883 RepID=UPI0006F3BDE7|nr:MULTISPECIES: sugar ABC transporter substrate-binding protein [Streptomyces]KQX91502.1 sugar-binding protein [Streptomyces sp. Root1319]KQZ20060.1 sugar-binding protein [Streptomyces sp. Root55]MDX3061450.1 sugar ABC transporter substrate-binding protein [Streptomyces sp. ND04-05B]RPK72313.1 Multiple sugar-binding protein precursor [Streptomyces sp. ADI97-07]WRY80296.1 sugar ABC transporter substrate-binding protein [Streptomyces clavifer]
MKMHRSRRLASAISLVSALALTATACGDDGSGLADGGGEGSGTGSIVFWDENGGVRTAVWNEIIADFEKANPDIDVEYVGLASTEAQSKYDTAIQGGGLPDVGGVGAAMIAGITAQDALEPLDKRIGGSSLEGKLNKAMLENVKSAGGRDEMYTVPISATNGVLYYRTDLFEKAQLDEPETWDDFYKAAEELTDKKKNVFGYTIRGGPGSIAQALDAMYGQSGIDSFWDAAEKKTTVNDPKNVEALEKYVGLYRKVTPAADLNNDFTKMVAQFDSGSIGMLNHNLGSYQDHVQALGTDKFRGIPQPKLADGTRVMVSNPVSGLGLFKSSKNKAAAWKFIEYAASHEANSKFSESAGLIPANQEAAEDAWLDKAEATKLGAEALFSGNTRIVQLPYYLPDWNTLSKADSEPGFQKVILGKMTAKEFLDTLAGQLNEAQAEWKERQGN